MSYTQGWPFKSTSGSAHPKDRKLAIAQRAELLAEVDLFSGLSKTKLNEIARVTTTHSWPAGTTIVSEGSRAEFCGVIISGEAQVLKGQRALRSLKSGELFGETALLSPGPRTATIEAVTEVVTLQLSRPHFVEVATSDPRILLRMLATMAERLRATDESLAN
ncbi:MAG: Crp/Fnr family transcriptional regulator [Actinomycetota bacterium]